MVLGLGAGSTQTVAALSEHAADDQWMVLALLMRPFTTLTHHNLKETFLDMVPKCWPWVLDLTCVHRDLRRASLQRRL